jgi:3-dehydroquinate synthase
MQKLVTDSARIKITVISEDEKEEGERRLLNFGHTIGHAIESCKGLKHGIAIAQGMLFAAELSHDDGLLTGAELERIRNILTEMELLPPITILKGKLAEYIVNDKKKEGDHLFFVFLDGIGKGKVRKISVESLVEKLDKKGF